MHRNEPQKTTMKVEPHKPTAEKKADDRGPDNPSKHPTDEPANLEPHRESGSGRHEPSP